MKKLLFLVAIALTYGAYSSSAQVYVNVRPPRPAVVRIAAPSPRHVWVDEDWREDHGAYVYTGGRWEAPPHPGYRYHPGNWEHSEHGDRWRGGGWRRR
jgi:hypothetical protein